MEKSHITATGIAVALAVVVAIGMLFFGPNIFAPFQAAEDDALSTEDPLMMNQSELPNELPNDLTISDVSVGEGAEATAGSQVTVNYVGMLPEGTVFDASSRHGQPFTFTLGAGQVIRGWDEGLIGMKEGGQRRLIVPPQFAYGDQAVGDVIPANATLIFEVELVEVQ